MKRILVVLGIVFGYTLVVECASVGAPGFLPERGRYIIGVEYNSVKGRNLNDPELGTLSLDAGGEGYIGKIVYGLSDRISLVAKVGAPELELWDPNASGAYNHASNLGWGLGIRTILFEDRKFGVSLGAAAQYFTFEPKETTDGRTAEWSEWDGSLYMCLVEIVTEAKHVVDPFVLTSSSLLLGVRASDAKVDWTYGSQSGQLKAADNFGYFVGLDFVFGHSYILGFEARFSDEKAYTSVLGFKF